MRKAAVVAAAILAAVFVFVGLTLPPAPVVASGPVSADLAVRTIPGAFHVHTTASDGVSSREDIAASAAAAGLRFVVFADHGDGTRSPAPAAYVHGVLCLDGVEISTNGGHYVALDMRASPYPLGGEAAAVIDDVRRLGGFGVAAHPDSGRQELGWGDWSAPFDGLEWLNADSEWRDERVRDLIRLPFDYLFRPAPALVATLDRPTAALRRWDELTSRRPAVGIGAHDAHGGIAGRREEGAAFGLPGFPSYRASFSAFAVRAIVNSALTGSAAEDGRQVIDAIRRGRIFTALDGIATGAYLDFTARFGNATALMGEALPFEPGVELSARATLPPGGTLRLICNGREAAQAPTGEVRYQPEEPQACRPEISAPSAPGTPPVPWLIGNPIYLLSAAIEPIGSEPLFETSLELHPNWVVEKEAGSRAAVTVVAGQAVVEYQLRPGERVSQYVAAVSPLAPPLPPFDRILFTASSGAPMRVSVQLRFPDGSRWVHSVYVEPDPRRVLVPLSALVAADGGGPATPPIRPDFRDASSILFVVDLTNAVPGTAGVLRLSDIAFAQAR